LYTTLWD